MGASKGAVNSFEDLIALATPLTDEVEVRGCKVLIRELSDRQRQEVNGALKDSAESFLAHVLVAGVINSEGKPVMTLEQVEQLGDSSPEVISVIAHKILDLSGIGGGEAGDPKNGSAQSNASSTD